MTPQTVSSRSLTRIIRQVIDHAGPDERSDLAHVRLESDGTHLFAVATDRLTLAVAREKLDHDLNPDAQPFSVLLYPRDAAHLAKIADDDEAWRIGIDNAAGGQAGVFAGLWTPGFAAAVADAWLHLADDMADHLAHLHATKPLHGGEPGWFVADENERAHEGWTATVRAALAYLREDAPKAVA